jgi:hypothetical protein
VNILWSIDGEFLVRESYWCGSLEHDSRSILRKRAGGGSHGCIQASAMSEILTTKVLDSQKTLFSDAHAGYLCIGCVYTRVGCV